MEHITGVMETGMCPEDPPYAAQVPGKKMIAVPSLARKNPKKVAQESKTNKHLVAARKRICRSSAAHAIIRNRCKRVFQPLTYTQLRQNAENPSTSLLEGERHW